MNYAGTMPDISVIYHVNVVFYIYSSSVRLGVSDGLCSEVVLPSIRLAPGDDGGHRRLGCFSKSEAFRVHFRGASAGDNMHGPACSSG